MTTITLDAETTERNAQTDATDTQASDTRASAPKRRPLSGLRDRRLVRPWRDRRLGGVCAGIADYLGINPLIVRIAFSVAALAGLSGVLVYLLAWLLIPSEPFEALVADI